MDINRSRPPKNGDVALWLSGVINDALRDAVEAGLCEEEAAGIAVSLARSRLSELRSLTALTEIQNRLHERYPTLEFSLPQDDLLRVFSPWPDNGEEGHDGPKGDSMLVSLAAIRVDKSGDLLDVAVKSIEDWVRGYGEWNLFLSKVGMLGGVPEELAQIEQTIAREDIKDLLGVDIASFQPPVFTEGSFKSVATILEAPFDITNTIPVSALKPFMADPKLMDPCAPGSRTVGSHHCRPPQHTAVEFPGDDPDPQPPKTEAELLQKIDYGKALCESSDRVVGVQSGWIVPDDFIQELMSYFVDSGRDNNRSNDEIREVASGLASELPHEANSKECKVALTREAFMQMIEEEFEDD